MSLCMCSLDAMLRGGYRESHVTELWGPPSSGLLDSKPPCVNGGKPSLQGYALPPGKADIPSVG